MPGMITVVIEMTGDVTPGRIIFDLSKQRQNFNFKDYNVTNYNGIDKRTLYYNWLANSTTTSHIVNHHNIFKTFESVKNTPITSIGGL